MNTKKNAVLKYSNYTAALTRCLKSAERVHCRVNEETHSVYVCTGYFLVKLTRTEYDALVRPVTQREAGNFVIDTNGETNAAMEPLDMEHILTDAARDAAHELTPAPFLVDPNVKGAKYRIATYYSESGDFVAGFNSEYSAIISAGLSRKGRNPNSPMVVFSGDEPQAMILPIRLESKDKPSRIPAAVRAWFSAAEQPKSESVEHLIHDVEAAKASAKQAENDATVLRRENEQLRQQYAEKHIEAEELRRQIEALTERLNSQPEPQPVPVDDLQPDQSPADKAAALAEKLTALEGITATVKGAQTAAPVVWLAGGADAHKDKIEAMGGKWSAKRSAWYFKI